MSLDYEILSQALFELEFELKDGKSWVMITEDSGVSNVKSIAEEVGYKSALFSGKGHLIF